MSWAHWWGLGALCKTTMFLFVPCVLIFLLLVPAYRRWLATPHPYLAFVLAMALFSPVVLWNAHNDWMMFRHTAAITARSRGAAPFRWFGDFLGGQAIALSPFIFLADLWAVGKVRPRRASDPAASFLFAFAAPILILCLVVSLRSKLEINWPVPTHLAGVMAVAAWFSAVWQGGSRAGRAAIVTSVGVGPILTLIAFFPPLLPALGMRIAAKTASKVNQTYGWPTIAARVQTARETLQTEGKPVFIAGVNYRVASVLAFYLPDQPETRELFFQTRRDQYWLWTDHARLIGQNAVLAFDDDSPEALATARQTFDRVEALPPVVVSRPGFVGPVKSWQIYLCHNFHGYDPRASVSGY